MSLGGFYPGRQPLSRTGYSRGTHPLQQRSLPRPETIVTKPASAAALAAPCPSLFSDSGSLAQNLVEAFLSVRNETERRAAPLTPEDQLIQSMPDASPAKWHRAHTTWFFEQFLLVPHVPGYKIFDEHFAYLFNSYYVSAGPRYARPQRGLIKRPGASEVARFRAHVDAAVDLLMEDASAVELRKLSPIVEIGLNHEQQHQELLITDILHAFAQNPTWPAYDADWKMPRGKSVDGFAPLPVGIHTIGDEGAGFVFDNERPTHQALIQPVRIQRGLGPTKEWLESIPDG